MISSNDSQTGYFQNLNFEKYHRKGYETENFPAQNPIILAFLMQNMDEAIVVTDLQDNIVFVNNSFIKYYGYKFDEVCNYHISILFPVHSHNYLFKTILFETHNGGWKGEAVGKKKNGIETLVSIKSKQLFDMNSFKHFNFYTISEDSGETFAEVFGEYYEANLKVILDNIIESIIIIDDELKIKWYNKKAFDTIFEKFETKIRTNLIFHELIPVDQRSVFNNYIQEAFLGNQNSLIEEIKTTNTSAFFEFRFIPIIHESGMKSLVQISFNIISSQKIEFAKEIIKVKNEAEKIDRLKTEFLAQMSHEIRTPINSVLSFTTLLKEEVSGFLSEEQQSIFKYIDSGGKRLIRTIDMILNMSQLQTGNYEYELKETDIADGWLESILLEFRSAAKEKNLNLIFTKLINSAVTTIDQYTTEQIFVNIIDNAIKYTHKGEVEIILYRNIGGYICVDVKDTGVGISKEYMPHLFTPFSQEEMGYTRRYDGNGLGLALVKRYSEINNIEIMINSEKNKGSTFTVIFMDGNKFNE
jgi:PAS domain S-box-containing protein